MYANGNLICSPNTVTYAPIIEEAISIVQPKISRKKEILPPKWICLKLLEGNEKIISMLDENLPFSLHSKKVQKAVSSALKLLEKNSINHDNFKDYIVSNIVFDAEKICKDVIHYSSENYSKRDIKIDKILTSKKFGIPIMLIFLGIIFWITIVAANIPSKLLSNFFNLLEGKFVYVLEWLNFPKWIISVLISGVYKTVTWIVSVMLPPMAIFFPLFTLLEDLGVLPRIAFNLDELFKKACTTGKQALTMCMGFGCNAAGVVGCRIIDSPRERLIAVITNSFVPCNGRFPLLITIAMIFFGGAYEGFSSSFIATIMVLLVILIGIIFTLLISQILSNTILKGFPSSFVLELPPYRKPKIGKILVRSIFDRTLFVLGRAIKIAAPAGIIIWVLANISFGNCTLLTYIANFFDPFAKLIGLDGYIVTAFILGLPANEIVLPLILMSYLSQRSLTNIDEIENIGEILKQHGWTILTAINVMLFSLLHFPCSTTLLTIKKETNSLKWTVASFVIPTICGIAVCMFTTFIWNIVR